MKKTPVKLLSPLNVVLGLTGLMCLAILHGHFTLDPHLAGMNDIVQPLLSPSITRDPTALALGHGGLQTPLSRPELNTDIGPQLAHTPLPQPSILSLAKVMQDLKTGLQSEDQAKKTLKSYLACLQNEKEGAYVGAQALCIRNAVKIGEKFPSLMAQVQVIQHEGKDFLNSSLQKAPGAPRSGPAKPSQTSLDANLPTPPHYSRVLGPTPPQPFIPGP